MSLFNTTAIPSNPSDIPDIWEKVVYQLNGSCDSLEQVLENNEVPELFDNDAFLEYLDNEIFRCTCCSWWCPVSETSENDNDGDWVCRDCSPNDDE